MGDICLFCRLQGARLAAPCAQGSVQFGCCISLGCAHPDLDRHGRPGHDQDTFRDHVPVTVRSLWDLDATSTEIATAQRDKGRHSREAAIGSASRSRSLCVEWRGRHYLSALQMDTRQLVITREVGLHELTAQPTHRVVSGHDGRFTVLTPVVGDARSLDIQWSPYTEGTVQLSAEPVFPGQAGDASGFGGLGAGLGAALDGTTESPWSGGLDGADATGAMDVGDLGAGAGPSTATGGEGGGLS